MNLLRCLFFCFLVTIALGAPHAQADSILNLTVDPSSVSGAPGDTVGWGFTLIDTSDVYSAIVLASDFCPGGVLASPCSTNGEPSLGVYTDNISSGPDFFLNPGDSDTETAGEFGGFGSLSGALMAGLRDGRGPLPAGGGSPAHIPASALTSSPNTSPP